jgi:hypothetical protein
MDEKLPAIILTISPVGVLIHDSIDYKQYKEDLKAIDLRREKGNELSVSFSFINKEKKMRLALPFSNSEIKDFYAMISELNKN